jgi:lipopolysaccharide heptosyltransferase I
MHIPPPAQPVVETGGKPLAVLFHATSKDDKKWPVAYWAEIGNELVRRGFHLVLPWGSASERAEAQQIVDRVPQASVLPQLGVTAIAQLVDAASFVIGVDTGFVHLAHALGKRTVMIFIATSPIIFGNEAPFRSTSIGDGHSVPPVAEALRAIDYVHGAPDGDNGQGGQNRPVVA